MYKIRTEIWLSPSAYLVFLKPCVKAPWPEKQNQANPPPNKSHL